MNAKHPTLLFFIKCLLALLPLLLLCGYTALFPLAYMDKEYPSWTYTKTITHTAQPKNEQMNDNGKTTLILGDSRAMADIIPAELGEHVQNLAVGGATTLEMYYALSNYLKHSEAPDNAVIMFAPFHYSYMDNFWERTAYFNYLSIPEMNEVLINAKKTSSATVLKDGYFIDALSYRLRLPNKYLPALLNSHFFGRCQDNYALYETLSAANGHGLFGTQNGSSDLNYEVNYTSMQHSSDADMIAFYLNKLLQLCEDNQITVILEQPPMNEASHSQLQESYLTEYTSYIEEIKTDHPAFYVNSTIPCYDNSLFGDSSHLNEAGALVYTGELKAKFLNIF